MTRRSFPGARGRDVADAPPFTTLVELTFQRKKIEHWIRFGRKSYEQIIDRRAEMLEIAENLHRSDLTALERKEQIARWIELTEEEQKGGEDVNNVKFSQVAKFESKRADGRGHRPEGGINAAARELSIDKDEAYRSVAIAALPPEAKTLAKELGLDDNQRALLAAARAAQQAEKAKEKNEPAPNIPTPEEVLRREHQKRQERTSNNRQRRATETAQASDELAQWLAAQSSLEDVPTLLSWLDALSPETSKKLRELTK